MTTDTIDKLLAVLETGSGEYIDYETLGILIKLAKTIKHEIVEIEDFVHERLKERQKLLDDVEFYRLLNKQTLRERTQAFKELRKFKLQAERYEKIRKLNIGQFQELYLENLKGTASFDSLVDCL